MEEYGRTGSIAKYEEHVIQNLRTGIWTEDDLLELDGKILGCWCSPKACHGDVLIMIIKRIKNYRRLGWSYTKQLQK
ncbi:hypothetical protein HWB57_gp082 [Erwinia phage vB_EamM-Bue1]|uniref:DUF4326 domain-containing protein n=1 Tax=Erwinia phage vB_EamM-Bue1 TaxID=2099338 RepID=A0A2P1JUA6_9CAUD|nr:hypothetical protein HWB57_gp082 [Erwinia phage vB_EamM-Bue1]AVO22922.1 hypothetical protein [Erwinia phage vB_EamM-Bue1]